MWQNDCLGATQALVVINGWLFKGSHAHDCAYAPGGFPQVNQGSGWVTHHLLDQSLTDGTLGHWTPDTNGHTGQARASARGRWPPTAASCSSAATSRTVNGQPQQGFAIFPAGRIRSTRRSPSVAPTVTSTVGGRRHGQLPGGQQPRRRHADLRDLPGRRHDADRAR